MNLKRRKAFYGDWWDAAAKWRTGGFDRLCAGVPGSPSTEEIQAQGIKGTLFVNEILTVRPGTALEFLDAVSQIRKPLMAEYGHQATGLYEVTSNQHEVVMVWATDIPSNVRWHQNRDATRGLCDEGEADERIVQWERISAQYVTGGDSHIMTPLPRTVYGPDDWEDASLDEWLNGAGFSLPGATKAGTKKAGTKKAGTKKAAAKKAAAKKAAKRPAGKSGAERRR
jgi:hypothetical protein